MEYTSIGSGRKQDPLRSKKDGKWLKELKFLGLIYNGAVKQLSKAE